MIQAMGAGKTRPYNARRIIFSNTISLSVVGIAADRLMILRR
jgi:hypothetical protein